MKASETPLNPKEEREVMNESTIFNVQVGFYPFHGTRDRKEVPARPIVLAKALESIQKPKADTLALIQNLRSETDNEKRKALKNDLAGFTPAVLCGNERNKQSIISYSGFVHLDIDHKENPNVTPAQMKDILRVFPFIAFVGDSVSGNGAFALAKIKPVSSEMEYLTNANAILQILAHTGLKLDESVSRNPVSFRYITIDLNPYVYDKAVDFVLEREQTTPNPSLKGGELQNEFPPFQGGTKGGENDYLKNNPTFQNVRYCILQIQGRELDLTNEYAHWVKIGFAFASEFGENGRELYHDVSRYYHRYSERETDKQYSECLKQERIPKEQKITIAYFFHLCKQHNIDTHYRIESPQIHTYESPLTNIQWKPKYLNKGTTTGANQPVKETLNDDNAFLEWFAQPNDDDDGEPFLPDEYRPKRFEPTMENVKALFENFGANATPYVEPVFYSEVKHSVYDGLRKRYAKGKEQKFINERLRKLQKEHRQTDKRGNILKYMPFLEMCECFGLRDAIKHVGFVVSLHQPERYPLYRTYLEAVNG